ncbi:MAG: GTP-binding protein [Lachnospiraceae bacterium]|nr:GTP-binding protein [Lachnospiraceae bacterium]
MTKIDIVSGFLGAGKTTFIQKMIRDVLHNEKVVLIENEFGEIGIDGGFMKEAGIDIKEMNSGCICCSLVGDFGTSLNEVITQYSPERILIEPSGVGKLSDVMKAVAGVSEGKPEVVMNAAVAVVDVSKAKMYIKNFGEFFINQIENAGTIVLSRTQNVTEEKLTATVELLRQYNEKATIITTPWDEIDGTKILETMESGMTMEEELLAQMKEELEHHHEEHDENCTCGCHDHDHEHHHHDHEDDHDHEHHHHDHEDDHDHEHHHHDHEDDHDHEHHHHDHEDDHDHEHHHHDHEHEHHHEHDENCTCGCHDHDHHHHHHHADEVFTSWGFETPKSYSADMISDILDSLEDETKYGFILRAKGMVPDKEGGFLYFDYVPEEKNIRKGAPEVTGKICVIGSKIQEENLKTLFGV